MSRLRSSSGQATIEWAGLATVVAILVLALMAIAPSVEGAIAGKVHEAICLLEGESCPVDGSGQAPPPPRRPTREELRAEAERIVSLSYPDFLDYKAHHPAADGFDWSDDSCSGPTPGFIDHLFDAACQLHDFGYRNFGHGLGLGRDEETRAWIDHRFLQEMVRICNDKFGAWYRYANRVACLDEAGAIYAAVRNFGRGAYY